MKQRTEEWHKMRLGKITSTGFAAVLSKKGNRRKEYMRQLILERKTGVSSENYSNEAMEWGVATEPQAREYYEKVTGNKVEEVGFVEHQGVDFIRYVGVSPDGLIGENAIIEIKCPNSKTHLEYIAKNALPTKHKPQVQGILWVTGRSFCDFVSFDPRVTEQPFWKIAIQRDNKYIQNLADETALFIDEMIKEKACIEEVDPQLLMDVSGGSSEDEWLQMKQMEIRGKVRHGVVCAMLSSGIHHPLGKDNTTNEAKKHINKIVDFIMTGE